MLSSIMIASFKVEEYSEDFSITLVTNAIKCRKAG